MNEVHIDYPQLLVETGILGFSVMVWFLWLVYWNAWPRLENWTSEIDGAVALACLLGITGILVHSFVDFNLQIPANAAWFYVLCVLAASTTPVESRQRIRRVRNKNPEHLAETETPAPGQWCF